VSLVEQFLDFALSAGDQCYMESGRGASGHSLEPPSIQCLQHALHGLMCVMRLHCLRNTRRLDAVQRVSPRLAFADQPFEEALAAR
jgi:hypothetical protein